MRGLWNRLVPRGEQKAYVVNYIVQLSSFNCLNGLVFKCCTCFACGQCKQHANYKHLLMTRNFNNQAKNQLKVP